jgi:hypothetical protein
MVSDRSSREQTTRDLIHKVRETYSQQGDPLLISSIVVHPGPKAWKEVSLLTFLDESTGAVRRRELKAQTWKAIPPSQGGGYDFTKDAYHWHCEDDEIEAVRVFLNGEFNEPGRYRLVKRGAEFDQLLEQIEPDEVNWGDLARLIQLASNAPQMVAKLAASANGTLLAEAVELQRRRDQLAELRRIVEDPASNERDHIHPQIKKMGWVFGGRYVGDSCRRQLTTGDVLDVPLLRPDGSLHVVELKGANIPRLVHQHRGPRDPQVTRKGREELPLIVGPEVHEAVGQAMNYLCHLDEDRDHVLVRFRIEARRCSATVLIGNPRFVNEDFSDEEIANTIRTYNSHLSRIEVLHYQDLIENAERDLALGAATADDRTGDEEVPMPHLEHDDAREQSSSSDPWSDEPPF